MYIIVFVVYTGYTFHAATMLGAVQIADSTESETSAGMVLVVRRKDK